MVFSRYLNSANGWFSVFSRLYFPKCICQKLSSAMGGSFFQGVEFHKWATSTKFVEFTYLEKTNYTVMWNMDTLYKIFLLWRLNNMYTYIVCTFKNVLLEYNHGWHQCSTCTHTNTHMHVRTHRHTQHIYIHTHTHTHKWNLWGNFDFYHHILRKLIFGSTDNVIFMRFVVVDNGLPCLSGWLRKSKEYVI